MIYFSRPTSRRPFRFNAIRPLILLLALVYPSAGVHAQTAGEVVPSAKPTTFTIDGVTTRATPSTISVKLGTEAGKTVLISSKMKLLVRQGYPCVEVEINGKPAVLIIDSGSNNNSISSEAAARLGLKSGTTTVTKKGFGGEVKGATEAPVEILKVGAFVYRDQKTYVNNFSKIFPFDGILGTPFLDLQVVTFDFQNQTLTLTCNGCYAPLKEDVALPLVITDDNSPMVRLGLGDKNELFDLDTGNNGTVLLYAPFVEKNELREAYKPTLNLIYGHGIGGLVRGDNARLPRLKIGDSEIAGIVGTLLSQAEGFEGESAGNIGTKIWQRFTLTIDYKNSTAYVHPNAQLNAPFKVPNFGAVTLDDKIADVAPNSPAQEAGIVIGDTLVDFVAVTLVDGRTLDKRAFATDKKAKLGVSGNKIRFKVRGADGKEREVVVTLRDLI